MSNVNFFNNDVSNQESLKELDPLFAVKEKDLHKHLIDSVRFREAECAELFNAQKMNLQCYLNQYNKKSGTQSDSLNRLPLPKTTKYWVNHLYEMTENLVSKMTRLKPAVDVVPSNDEYEDKSSAKAVELLINHLWYINDIDFLLQKVHRHKYIFGEAFLNITWNPSKGDFSPEYALLKQKGKADQIKPGTPIRTGDVDYELLLPWQVLLDMQSDYSKIRDAIIKECIHIEDLKHKYPQADIENTKLGSNNFDISIGKDKKLSKHVDLYTLYYRADDHFPDGRKIVFTNFEILEDGKLEYSHGDFPFVRLTDIEVPGNVRGLSRYQQVLVLQNAHNNLSQSIIKNEFLCSAPKWMMPRGAVKTEQLANGNRIVQYQGAVPPTLVQMNPTSPTTVALRDKMEIELGSIMGVHQISRGEPPTGITAAVALQFLNEQEVERGMSDISKHNQAIVDIAKKSISVAGDYYRSEDGRTLRILGKENKYLIKQLDTAALHKDYDIKIQVGSALPQSKSARMERIIQTMQYAPTLFTQERWAELLEFGSVEKMHTLITEAIVSAESENESILEGELTEEPKEWEDIITHLQVHYKKMQSRSFKEDVSESNREAFITHIKVTEMLAAEKAKINPLFASKLAQLELYPMFWSAPVPASAAQQEALVMGQANRGEAVTGQIPAEEAAFPGQQKQS